MKLKECTFVWSEAVPAEIPLAPPRTLNVKDAGLKRAGDGRAIIPAPGLYIGREMRQTGTVPTLSASDWRNEHKPASDSTIDRAAAIRRYIEALLESPIRARIGELAGRDLLCWCAPKLCHGNALEQLTACTRFYGAACPHCGTIVDSFLNWHEGLQVLSEAWVCRSKACGRRGDARREVPQCLSPDAQPLLL